MTVTTCPRTTYRGNWPRNAFTRYAAIKSTPDKLNQRGAAAPRSGNLKTRQDARGKLATYSYDVLNRVTQISYGDQTVTWDACTNGIGRLCQIIDGSGTSSFAYDPSGRLTGRRQTLGAVTLATAYAYNGAGQLIGLTTPSGQSIAVDWAHGRISAIRINGTTLLNGLQYQPFGPTAHGLAQQRLLGLVLEDNRGDNGGCVKPRLVIASTAAGTTVEFTGRQPGARGYLVAADGSEVPVSYIALDLLDWEYRSVRPDPAALSHGACAITRQARIEF